MKKLLLATLALLAVHSIYAQHSLKGKVTGKDTQAGLIGAIVYLPDLKKGASTNADGSYRLSSLPKGKFLVEIRYIGYAATVVLVTVNGEKQADFALAPSATELNEVVVTGVSAATEIKRNPVPTTIVGRDILLQNTSTNIIDAITRQPGVAQVSTGPAISKPVIRGLSYNRVLTLYNGVRQEGQQWGDEHGTEIDEFSVDRVEIIKGPGSLMYGSDGLAGVINILTPNPLAEGNITGNWLTQYQTNNGQLGYSAMTAGTLKGINWLVRASGKNAGNYRNANDGLVYNSGFRETDLNGFMGLSKKWGYTELHFASFDQHLAITEGERDKLGNFTKPAVESNGEIDTQTVTDTDLKGYQIGIPNQRIRHNRLLLANNFYFGQSRLVINAGYQLSERKEFGDPLNPSQFGLYFYLPTFNYDVKYFLPELDGWKTTVGVSGMHQSNENKGREFLIPDYQLSDIGGFAFAHKSFGRLDLSGGIRYDQRKVTTQDLFLANDVHVPSTTPGAEAKFTGFSGKYGSYSGSVGATYGLTEQFLVKANIARGYRAPNMAELGSNGRHEGSFRYEIGDPALKAETSLQTDLGITFNTQHITVEASVFNNQMQQYIFAQRLRSVAGGDSITNPDEPVPTYRYGQSNAQLTGGELTIDIHPHPLDWLHFENSFSIVRGQHAGQPDSTKYLPFMPAPRYQSELRANVKKVSSFLSNSFFKINLDHFFDQNQYLKENHTETHTPGYTLVNLGLGSDITTHNGTKLCSLYLSVNNLFDVAYQSHLSRLKYNPENPATGRMGVFNMGRNVSMKLVVPITFRKPSAHS
ncbi:MAG: TonB-dependent receptor [Bacteroidota bacterium]